MKLVFRIFFSIICLVVISQSQVHANFLSHNSINKNSKLNAYREVKITGQIIDALTAEPVPFANITYNNGRKGTIASFDGHFELLIPDTIGGLNFSSVGYEPYLMYLSGMDLSQNISIKLKRKFLELSEVVIRPGENPAHRIINNVVANKEKNNPEKVRSFSYTAYNKMYFTLQEDTLLKGNQLPLVIDSLERDSNEIRIKTLINKQHLFLTEFVSERQFRYPDKNHEKVLSSKVSGMRDPVFVMLATQFQSFSFYNEYVTLLDRGYLNPISKGSSGRYLFVLEDTIFTYLPDTVFVISFRPRKGKNFEGLKGFLYINTNGYAVQNVTAEPSSFDTRFSIKIQQQYDFVGNKQWFPTQLNTNLIFKNSKVKTRSRELYMAGIGKSYLSNIVIDSIDTFSNFSNIELEISPDAGKRDRNFWDNYRTTPLTRKDSITYQIIDSVGSKSHLNEKMLLVEAMLYGYIPIGGFNVEINKLINYNKYEGLKVGMKLFTNPKVFSFASIGGFYVYGFGDEQSKYGGFVQLFPRWYSDTKLTIRYAKNVTETGGFSYLDDYTLNSSEFIRSYYIYKMDKTEEKEVSFSFRAMKYFKFNVYLNESYKLFKNYLFLSPDLPSGYADRLIFTEAGLQLKFAWGEKFMKTPRGKLISMGTKYPVVWLNYRRGLKILNGEMEYNKFEGKISASFTTKQFGKSQFQIKVGKIFEELPLPNTYSALGCYETFSMDVENYFNAVRPGEFYSSEFASVFFRQNFGSLLFGGKKFKPELHFVTNAGWGKLPNLWKHQGEGFKTMEKGYYESGIVLNKMYNLGIIGLGLGVYYRYGYYGFNKTIDNFAFKMAFSYSL